MENTYMTMNIPIMFKVILIMRMIESFIIDPIDLFAYFSIWDNQVYVMFAFNIFSRISLCWDTTDIIAITVNGVCPSCIYQWSMRCPCSNYHVPLSLHSFLLLLLLLLLFLLFWWYYKCPTLTYDGKKGTAKLLIPMLCYCSNQKAEKDRNRLSVYHSTFFFFFVFFFLLYADMMRLMTHTCT